MAKLTEKQKLTGIGGGALAICLLAGGGVYWASGLIDDERKAIEQKHTEISAADQKIAKVPATETEVIILRENLDEYVKILPDTQGLNDFITTLNQFVTQSGVITQNFQPGRLIKSTSKTPEKFSRVEYQYDMTATLWQFLKFINLIENYERFISITDFSIQHINGRDAEQRDGDQVHSIKLTMETYVYNAKGAAQDVDIPDYKDKRELLHDEIVKRLQFTRMEKYEHHGGRGRRDIFVDPRDREGRQDGPPVEEQKAILERFIGDVRKVRDLATRRKHAETVFDAYTLDKEINERLDKLESGAQEIAARQQLTAPNLRLRWVKEVVEPLAELRSSGNQKDPRITNDAFLSQQELKVLTDRMRKKMEEGDLEAAESDYESVAQKILVPETDPRHTLAVEAQALHLKARTAMEFKGLDLKIQGVLVNHDGGRSGLLVNGVTYEEGDYIQDDLMLRKVEEEQIWFVFRGLTLIRTL
jgi:Tfp pilus assembly protein PilO